MTTRKIVGALVTLLAAGALAFVATPTAAHLPLAQHGGSGACTLFCIQGYHCVNHGGNMSCVPNR